MKMSYRDELIRKIRQATKQGNKLAADYYRENLSGYACASWEVFSTSWAGQNWIKQHTQQKP